MLVKFISFAITVVGTARYKAILLSTTALVVSFTSVSVVLLSHDSQAAQRDAVSSGSQSRDVLDTSKATSPAHIAARDAASATPQSQQSTNTPAKSDQTSSSSPVVSATTSTNNVTIVPAKTSITVTASDTQAITTDAITAATSDNSTVMWTVESSDSTNLSIDASKNASNEVSFKVTVAANTPKKTYQVTLTAKDANRNLVVTKTIDLIVQ